MPPVTPLPSSPSTAARHSEHVRGQHRTINVSSSIVLIKVAREQLIGRNVPSTAPRCSSIIGSIPSCSRGKLRLPTDLEPHLKGDQLDAHWAHCPRTQRMFGRSSPGPRIDIGEPGKEVSATFSRARAREDLDEILLEL
jgi:hypothetical protein